MEKRFGAQTAGMCDELVGMAFAKVTVMKASHFLFSAAALLLIGQPSISSAQKAGKGWTKTSTTGRMRVRSHGHGATTASTASKRPTSKAPVRLRALVRQQAPRHAGKLVAAQAPVKLKSQRTSTQVLTQLGTSKLTKFMPSNTSAKIVRSLSPNAVRKALGLRVKLSKAELIEFQDGRAAVSVLEANRPKGAVYVLKRGPALSAK